MPELNCDVNQRFIDKKDKVIKTESLPGNTDYGVSSGALCNHLVGDFIKGTFHEEYPPINAVSFTENMAPLPEDPYGMVYIPQGSFTMGPSDQDVPFANVSQAKTVSVGAFYMDETEVTNAQFSKFIEAGVRTF